MRQLGSNYTNLLKKPPAQQLNTGQAHCSNVWSHKYFFCSGNSFFTKFSSVMVVLLGLFTPCYLLSNDPNIFETPTALTLEKGEFQIKTYFYDKGGVLLRFELGASPYFNLGIVEYFDRLIGTNIGIPSIPNGYVKAKIPLPSGKLASLDMAIGYDAIYRGSFKPFPQKLYGIYAVMTLGLPGLSQKLYAPHYLSFGVRYPVIFKMDVPDAFFSLHLRFHRAFQLASEISNIHLGKTSRFRFINNNVIFIGLGYGITFKTTLQIAGIKTGPKIKDYRHKLGIAFAIGFRNFF